MKLLSIVGILLIFVSCSSNKSPSKISKVEKDKNEDNLIIQQYFVFTSFAPNLSTQGCTNSVFRVKWPTFSIQEIKADSSTCFFNGESVFSSHAHMQAKTNNGDVVFSSNSENIEENINSGIKHIYYWDQDTYKFERIDKGLDALEPNDHAMAPVVSADGRFVCYSSAANNIVENDTNNNYDIFLYDRIQHSTIRIQNGLSQPNGPSGECSISRDGKILAFASTASNLVPGDLNAVSDIFVYNIETQNLEIASVTSSETQGVEQATSPYISGNGRYIVFLSDQLDSDGDNNVDLFLRDREAGLTHKVSKAVDEEEIDSYLVYGSIDDSGRYIVYCSGSTNIVPSVTDGIGQIYLYDRISDTTKLISHSSINAAGNNYSNTPNITPDGKYIVYHSSSTNLTNDSVYGSDIYIYDIQNQTNHLLSKKEDGTPADSNSAIEY
jgi:Tol biopolymer transport system component